MLTRSLPHSSETGKTASSYESLAISLARSPQHWGNRCLCGHACVGHVGPGNLNSGSHAPAASAFTLPAISPPCVNDFTSDLTIENEHINICVLVSLSARHS